MPSDPADYVRQGRPWPWVTDDRVLSAAARCCHSHTPRHRNSQFDTATQLAGTTCNLLVTTRTPSPKNLAFLARSTPPVPTLIHFQPAREIYIILIPAVNNYYSENLPDVKPASQLRHNDMPEPSRLLPRNASDQIHVQFGEVPPSNL